MPKRPFPFEDSFTSQQKIHVCDRHVNEGVMKNENMKKVYDNTLKMLFTGSKQIFKNNSVNNDNNNNDFIKISCAYNVTITQNPLKQLEISSQGKLLRPNNNHCNNTFHQSSQCKICSQEGNGTTFSCGYCDSSLCEQCLKFCFKCHKGFCMPCSFTEYNGNSEHIVCLSCY